MYFVMNCLSCESAMDKKLPEFLKGEPLPKGYYDATNPYEDPSKSDVNLRELSRYARECGKRIVDLTKEEVGMFRTKP